MRYQPAARLRRYAALITLMLLVAACASHDEKDPPPLNPTFHTLSLATPEDFVDVGGPRSREDKAEQGMSTMGTVGAVGGAIAGSAILATACGPYLYTICLMGSIAQGLLAGAAVGGIAGMGVGSLAGLSGVKTEDAAALEEKTEQLLKAQDYHEVLADKLRERLPPEMLAPPEEADVQSLIVVSSISFKQKDSGEDEPIYIRVRARFQFATDEAEGRPAGGWYKFAGRGELRSLDDWLAPGTGALELDMDSGLDQIADGISEALVARWQPGP